MRSVADRISFKTVKFYLINCSEAMSRCFSDFPSEHSQRSYPKVQGDHFYVCKNYLVQPTLKRTMVTALTSIEANTKVIPADASSAGWVRPVLRCSDYYR